MYELVQPYISDIVQSLIGLIVIVLIGVIAELRKRALVWIDTRNNKQQRELLHYICAESFAFIEQTMRGEPAQNKLIAAIQRSSEILEAMNINVTTSEIRSAIEKAVLEYNSKVK